jgi:hypothetical protein
MSRHVFAAAFILALAASAGRAPGASAQSPPPAEKPAPGQALAPNEAPSRGQPVNVKLDLTITDQLGPGEPAKKTVSMIVADRYQGAIRSAGNSVRAVLNVDATPNILSSGSIRLQLGIEYNPRQAAVQQQIKGPGGELMPLPPEPGGSSLNQRVVILLEPGKPMILSQAADPISDRKIVVEVRATILK